MTIEVTILISVVSVSFAVFFGLLNARRNDKNDIVAEVTKTAEIGATLRSIHEGVTEIKADIRRIHDNVEELRERVVQAEDQAKSAHKRLDDLLRHGGEDK